MFDKLNKLEEKLNQLIERIQLWLIAFFYKVIPKSLLSKLRAYKLKLKIKWTQFSGSIIVHFTKFKNKTITTKNHVSNFINALLEYPVKEKIFLILDKIKVLLLKTPLKNHASKVNSLLKTYINKIDYIMEKLGKPQLAMAVTVFILMGVGLTSMYNSSQRFMIKEFPDRAPANIQDYAYKPDYKMFKKKTLKVMNIKVPVLQENVKQVKSVTVDFTVRTSTRFAKQYLEHYENQLKDYFFTTVEPVVSSFPLEREGKDILKEKILYELNNFLKENNVEGFVEQVDIVFIIGT